MAEDDEAGRRSVRTGWLPGKPSATGAHDRYDQRMRIPTSLVALVITFVASCAPTGGEGESAPSHPSSPGPLLSAPLVSADPAGAAASAAGADPVSDPGPAANLPPLPESLTRGVDVSSHSGAVDWPSVRKAGHDFAYIKASEGVDFEDAAFAGNWRSARAAGLRRGPYHFYVTEDDPAEQARFFASRFQLEPGDLAPVVDVEFIGHGTKPGLADRLRTFLVTLEKECGAKPVIYTSARFWDEHVGPGFGEHALWIAEYDVKAPILPAGWDAWHLWQWKGDAPVDGVEHSADLSRVNPAHPDVTKLLVAR